METNWDGYQSSIVGYADYSYINNCYNNLYIKGSQAAGICMESNNTKIINCINEGKIVADYAGGICENSTYNEIINCSNDGEIAGYIVSGIVSRASNIKIYNCSNKATIREDHTYKKNSPGYLAGILAWYGNGYIIVKNCFNTGDINTELSWYAHGIAIYATEISNCYNTGNINNLFIANTGVSGICHSVGSINNCYNTGDITGSENSDVAGILSFGSSSIENCYNTGKVTGGYAGGIQGGFPITGTIKKCYNTGNISGTKGTGGIAALNGVLYDCYNEGNINGQNYVGGLVGQNGIIINSYNLGDVTGKDFVSGLASMHSSGIVINSYNSGNITGETNVSGIVSSDQFGSIILNSYNTGNVTGTSIVSGIANITRQIDNVYNSGKVTGSSDVAQIYNIIEDGYEGLVKNAYYLDNNSEELEKEGTNSKTEIEMKSIEFAQLLNSNRIEMDLSEVENICNYYLGTEKNALEWQYKLGEYPTFNLLKRININMDNEEITQLQNNSEVTEITVENEIKKYNITTEIGINSAGERVGGTVKGDYNEKFVESAKIKFVETVKHGDANGETIEITPNADYDIVKITINGEEVTFDLDENGKAIIKPGYFEHVTEDKHIVVIFEKGLSKVIEHHYLKNSEGNYTTIPVADDVYYTGKKGEEYTTSPKTNLKDVTLEKNENKEYVIPSNARGEYKEEIQEVTYYYEPKGINLIVRHYFEGTENNIILNGQKAIK